MRSTQSFGHSVLVPSVRCTIHNVCMCGGANAGYTKAIRQRIGTMRLYKNITKYWEDCIVCLICLYICSHQFVTYNIYFDVDLHMKTDFRSISIMFASAVWQRIIEVNQCSLVCEKNQTNKQKTAHTIQIGFTAIHPKWVNVDLGICLAVNPNALYSYIWSRGMKSTRRS